MRILVSGDPRYTSVLQEQRTQMVLSMFLALAELLEQKLTVVYGNSEAGFDAVVDRWVLRRSDEVIGEQIPMDGRSRATVFSSACLLGPVDMWLAFGERVPRNEARFSRLVAHEVP